MKFSLIIGLLTLIYSSVATQERFDNYVVYNLKVNTIEQLKQLQKIETNEYEYEFWKSAKLGQGADIMVDPSKRLKFEELMKTLDIQHNITINNVQSLIDNERPKTRSTSFGWEDYHTLDNIYNWLDEKIAENPLILTNHIVGTSYQGREIRAVLLKHKDTNPLVIVESNIHAREWITSATATWLLNELLTSTNPKIKDLAENINWLIMPVFNVDGFAYTKSTNRLWRKTRQPHSTLCYGTDPNRNFDFEWLTIGASSNPCQDTFGGPKAFSEPETKQWSNFVKKFKDQAKIYISLHAYGQYFMFPFGHTKDPPHNIEILTSIGKKTAEGIERLYGTDYIVGQSSVVLYESSGSSVDWIVNEFNNSILGLIFELRDKRGGPYGMILPAEQIIPNCLEFMDGMVELIKEAKELQQI